MKPCLVLLLGAALGLAGCQQPSSKPTVVNDEGSAAHTRRPLVTNRADPKVVNERNVAAHAHLPLVTNQADLKTYIGQKIRLAGTYHDPGKGNRRLRCGFYDFVISDNSFYRHETNGTLTALLENDIRVEVVVRLKFFPGSRSEEKAEDLPIQEEAPKIEEIDGKKYRVSEPEYYLVEGEILRVW